MENVNTNYQVIRINRNSGYKASHDVIATVATLDEALLKASRASEGRNRQAYVKVDFRTVARFMNGSRI